MDGSNGSPVGTGLGGLGGVSSGSVSVGIGQISVGTDQGMVVRGPGMVTTGIGMASSDICTRSSDTADLIGSGIGYNFHQCPKLWKQQFFK